MFGRSRSIISEVPPAPVNGNGNGNDATHVIDEGDVGVPLWQPTQVGAGKSVEQLLLERGQINESHLEQARQLASKTPGKTLAQLLLQMSAASEAQILAALAETLGMNFEQPDKTQVDVRAFELLPVDYIRKNLVLPVRFEDKTLVVAMTDPTNVFLLDEVKRRTKRNVRSIVTTATDINRLIEQLTSSNSDIKVDEIIKDIADDDVQLIKDAE